MTDALLQQQPPAAPSTPAEAATRLDQLKSDQDWGAKVIAGDGPAYREFLDLQQLIAKGDDIDLAMAGERLPGLFQSGEHLENMATASMLREVGIRDEIIKDVLAGTHTVTRAEYDATVRWKADHFSDSVWVKSYLGGSAEARRQATLADLILTANVKG